MAAAPSTERSTRRLRRLRRFVGGQKALEGLAAFLAGAHTGSVALVAFALVSGADLIGLLTERTPQRGTPDGDRRTSRLLGFGALAAGGYVLLRAGHAILAPTPPVPTLLGEGIVAVSIVLTVVLFWAARRALLASHFDPSVALKGAALRLLLGVSVLAGLVLNGALGLWMADPLGALPVAGFFFFTGKRLLREERRGQNARAALPEAGRLMASIVAHVGAEHAGRRIRLQIIVCGGGGLGLHTAQALTEDGHDVSVVEADVARCHALREKDAGAVVFGDATDPDVLRRAGIEQCAVVAALSGSAKTNRRICRAAERESSVRTVMRAPFAAEAPAANEQAGVRRLGALNGGLRILELRVAAHAPIAGQRLADIQFPSGGRVLSTAAGESVDKEAVFASGGRYVVVASEKAATAMTRLFRGQYSSRPSV